MLGLVLCSAILGMPRAAFGRAGGSAAHSIRSSPRRLPGGEANLIVPDLFDRRFPRHQRDGRC